MRLSISAVPIGARWHLRRWQRSQPGVSGVVALALFTALLLAPVHTLFDKATWVQTWPILFWLASVSAAFPLMKGITASDEIEAWCVWRGESPARWALERWVATVSLFIPLAVLWSACAWIAAAMYDSPGSVAWALSIAIQVLGFGVVISALFFTLGATSHKNSSEVVFLSLIIALAKPVIAPDGGIRRIALDIISPPIDRIVELRHAVRANDVRGALESGLFATTWVFVVLAIGLVLLSRRRTPQ